MAGETITTIIGRLTSDPEARVSRAGKTFATFSVAVTPSVYDASTRTWRDGDTSFYDVTAFNAADNIIASLHKGDRVAVHGRLEVVRYEGASGTRTAVRMTADEVAASTKFATVNIQRSTNGNGGGYQRPAQPAAGQPAQEPIEDPFAMPAGTSAPAGGGW